MPPNHAFCTGSVGLGFARRHRGVLAAASHTVSNAKSQLPPLHDLVRLDGCSRYRVDLRHNRRQRRIRVGAGTVAFTAVVGGILGTVAAATLEYDTLRALGADAHGWPDRRSEQDRRANCGFPDRSTSEVA
jgi:hypothetical protein